MKKVVLVCLAAALAVTSAFAEIRLAGFGRAVPILLADQGDGDLKAGRAISWGHPTWGGDYDLGFVVEGRTNYAGFYVDVGFSTLPSNAEDYTKNWGRVQKFTTADQAKVWVKPCDIVTISAGRVLDKSVRGDLAYGMFDWIRSGAGRLGEALTFTAFHKIGLYLTVAPIKQLYIFAGVPLDEFVAGAATKGVYDAKTIYRQVQGGIAYKFDNVGILKAQYIGSKEEATIGTVKGNCYGTAEIAFDLTRVENLKLTAGFHYVFGDDRIIRMKKDEGVKNETERYFSIGAEYKFKVAKVDALFRGAFNPNEDFGIYFGIGSTFFLPKSWEVVADIRFQNERCENGKIVEIQKSKKNDAGSLAEFATVHRASLSFLIGVQKQIPGGVFGIGFVGATNGGNIGPIENLDTKKDGSFIWAIPLRLEYKF